MLIASQLSCAKQSRVSDSAAFPNKDIIPENIKNVISRILGMIIVIFKSAKNDLMH
jgi:hypothetical protein